MITLQSDAQVTYQYLLDRFADVAACDEELRLLRWDQKVAAPPTVGRSQHGRKMAVLAEVRDRLMRDPWLAETLNSAEAADTDADAHLQEMRRQHKQHVQRPPELLIALAAATARGQRAWRAARKSGDASEFLPILTEIVALKREEGAALAQSGAATPPYDALLKSYEPSATAEGLRRLFADVRAGLAAIPSRSDRAMLPIPELSKSALLAVSYDLARCLGLDPACSRIDLAEDPFACALPSDYRIAIRINSMKPLDTLLFTAHETGHMLYEQGLDRAGRTGPASAYASMAIHESQSRLYETCILSDPGFARIVGMIIADHTDCDAKTATGQFLSRLNRPRTKSPRRIEAGFAEYDLHIMLRFELEQALINGDLKVADLPEEWRLLSLNYLGSTSQDLADGFMQDEHWAVGHFGYFPCYTLGNVYAAQLWEAMSHDIPAFEEKLLQGDCRAIGRWLYRKLYRHGRKTDPKTLIEKATGIPKSSTDSYLRVLVVGS